MMLLGLKAHGMNVGFNQAWFHNDYALQYLDSHFDRAEVQRIMKLNQEAGSKSLRLWLFESSNFPMLEWENGKIARPRADFIRNFLTTLQIAKEHKIKIYMTFFDAHTYRPDQLKKEDLKKLRSLFQEAGSDHFLKKVIGPLLKAIQEAGLADVINRIDICNEMDTVINRFGFDYGWQGARRMMCQWRSFIQAHPGFTTTPTTFSLRLHPVIIHPLNLFSDKGPMACADFLDFHSYGDSGDIYRCDRLKKYASLGKKELVLGEFGQSYLNHRYDDELQLKNTIAYLKNAQKCGFKEALAWRLSDVRPGVNKEARYSFEAFGKMRPAYQVIQEHNLSHPEK
jgi:hypothetical protein